MIQLQEYPDVAYKKVLRIALQFVIDKQGFTEEDLQTCWFVIDQGCYGF